MKPRVLLSCLFAAYGVYVIVSSVFALTAMLVSTRLGPAQWLEHFGLYLIPLGTGGALVLLSGALGNWSARFAGVPDDTLWELRLSAEEALAVLLAAIGVFFVIQRGAVLVRGLILLLGSEAGGQQLARAAGDALGDASQLSAPAIGMVAGAALAKLCRPLARALLGQRAQA